MRLLSCRTGTVAPLLGFMYPTHVLIKFSEKNYKPHEEALIWFSEITTTYRCFGNVSTVIKHGKYNCNDCLCWRNHSTSTLKPAFISSQIGGKEPKRTKSRTRHGTQSCHRCIFSGEKVVPAWAVKFWLNMAWCSKNRTGLTASSRVTCLGLTEYNACVPVLAKLESSSWSIDAACMLLLCFCYVNRNSKRTMRYSSGRQVAITSRASAPAASTRA
jgi:hypothetical protein